MSKAVALRDATVACLVATATVAGLVGLMQRSWT